MTNFFNWLSSNPIATIVLIVAFGILIIALTLIYVIAFFQGREISFWPPKIGERPNRKEKEETDSPVKSSKTSLTTKIKFLFIASNPKNTPRLSLDEEIQLIKKGFNKAKLGSMFEIEQEWSVSKNDLQTFLLNHKPCIVHISCHATKEGIILQDESGNSSIVTYEYLDRLFYSFRNEIQLIIFNTHYTEEIGKMIAQYIDFVIGIDGLVSDNNAINFASSFYQALGNNRDIKTAFDLGCAQVDDPSTIYKLFAFRKQPEGYKLLKESDQSKVFHVSSKL